MSPLRVLTHVGGDVVDRIRAVVPDAEVVAVPWDGPVPDGVEGEVLFTLAWGSPNMADVAARGVRWIHTLGTGVDRFPLDAVGDRVLTCSRGASAIPISEFVLAAMLAFEKRLPDIWLREAPEHWHSAQLGALHGRTLGLVGLGGIGSAVADRALPFGMRVVALRRSDRPAHRPEVELVHSLPELLGAADHVVVTAPATPETRHLLDARAFAAMRPGVHLVNISRGALVDQDALRAALDDGTVAMASLDTVEPEPLPAGHWMYTHPRVRLSAHVSWSMPGSHDLLIQTFLDNLVRYAAGEPLEGVVDVGARY